MPDTALSNQLPPRTPTSIREPRTYSTFGGRGSTTNDSDLNENISKINGHHRNSKSLFRKSSTISRTDDTSIPVDENPSTSLKKSRSLMNVLRSKLNSPAVLRRFRSKSRESTKQTVTDINGHTTNDQEQDIKQSNNEQIPTRKSRKRDPSPMRRLANRISQFTRHQRTTSSERQKKSPSKSITNDSNEEPTKSSSPLHNKDEVDHINACYNEIRAKYFNNNNNNNNTNKPQVSIDDTQNRSLSTISMNGSLLSNDFFNNSQRISSPIPLSDDPLLQARKQSNIKLNCMLSGYTLTTSFANHEKLVGQNDLFKFNHYYDVGKRKYDWNFTNTNNRIFSSMKTRPISKSIDTFRRTNTNDNEVPVRLEKINIVDNDPLVQTENHEDVPKILSNDNELFIYEDNDLIESKQNTSQYSTNILDKPIVPISSILIDENKMNSNEQTVEEHDEEFERNFLRAVDRALGVVNKDEDSLIQSNDTIPIETDQSHLNLIQMTERALSSLNNSPLFTNDDEKNVVENEEQIKNDTELANTEVFDHIDQSLNNEELSKVDIEKPINDESLYNEELSKVDIEKPINDESLNNEELSKVDTEKPINDESLNNEELSKVDIEKPINDESLNNEELSKVDTEKPINDESLNNEELSKVDIEKPINDESLNNEELSKVDIEKPINDDDLIDEDISSTIDNLIEKVEELLFEDSKVGSIND